ncbi:hypothetical protein [Serratia sp. 2723]|uniref:hypothetical protein n=1 Tax=unclassified Serratia (in: enterobacteria) TaxID=2647522 RepID=UPI003D23A14C
MKWNKENFLLLILFGMISFISHAETPRENVSAESMKSILKIDDFLPEKKSWSFGTGINIINDSSNGAYSGVYINQISPGQYVIDRTSLSYRREKNGVSGYFSGMYGVTRQLSLSATANGQWVNTKFSLENDGSSTKNEYRFNGIGVGVSYQFYRLSDYTVLFSGGNFKHGSLQSYVLGSSLSWIYDPVVLNLSLGYLDGISKEKFANDYKAYTLSGKVVFAINPEINLNWGVSKDVINAYGYISNQKEWSSKTSLLVGTAVNLAENTIGSVSAKGGVGNNKGSVISIGLNYRM